MNLVVWDSLFARCREFVKRTSSPLFDDWNDGLEVRPTLTFGCHETLAVSVFAAILQIVVALVCLTTGWQAAVAEDKTPKPGTLARIFGEDVLSDDVLGVHDAGRDLNDEHNYSRLRDWVLPSETHHSWRLSLSFRNGELIAPAVDLIQVATRLDKLKALQLQIESTKVSGPYQHRCRLAMLSLVDFAVGEKGRAEARLGKLFETYDTRWVTYSEQIPETLAVLSAAQQPQQDPALLDYVSRMVLGFMLENERNAWQLKLWEVYSTGKSAEYRSDEQLQSADNLKQWTPVSSVTAKTHGEGNPVAKWGFDNGRVDIQSSHSRDYLYFRSPLRGQFVVEGDMTTFGFRGSHLAYADLEVIPVYNLEEYALCQFRSQEARFPLTPKAWEPREWFRCRLEIADGLATTTFNGHLYPPQKLAADHDPWLSICSPVRFSGGARNLRITGNAYVPEQIPLATSERLSGWLAYYDDASLYQSDMRQPSDESSGVWSFDSDSLTGGIIGQRESHLAGDCHNERLLRYHRPMLEDGAIEYDFLYREGQNSACPSVGRLAFLLHPDGVKLHRITDGRFERTELSPDNVQSLSEPASGKLVLKQNDWNQLRCILSGNQLQLVLNGIPVATYELAATEDRTFGLFYYSDKTELRVRNLHWSGDWPRQLPSVPQQEMAGRTTEDLDTSAMALSESFFHDFAENGLTMDVARITKGTAGLDIIATQHGLHASRRGVGRYQDASAGLNFGVEGDFDISTQFTGLQTECYDGDSSTIALRAAFDDSSQTRCSLRRCRLKEGKTPLKPVVRCYHEYHQPIEDEKSQTRRITFEQDTCEAVSGTLRLARRGGQLYFLLAEGLSDYFRVIGVREVGKSALKIGGFDLLCQLNSTSEDAVTAVVWRNISVRADKIVRETSPKVETISIAKLNEDRDQYAALVDYDFSQMQTGIESFVRWGNADSFRHTPDGVRFTSLGTEGWTSTGAWPGMNLEGDFDVSSTFEIEKVIPAEPKGESCVYMQAIFYDQQQTSFSTIWDDGVLTCRVKTRGQDGNSRYDYLQKEHLGDVTSLRYARRGNVVYAVVTAGTPAKERVFAAGTLNQAASDAGARITFLVQTRGVGRETHCLWKRVSVHQPIQNIPRQIRLPAPPGGA